MKKLFITDYSQHIHGLLLARVEKAAERILSLENCIAELYALSSIPIGCRLLTITREDDFDINQSELKFLRIQLQAIEAQSSPYTLRDEDDELTQSILNWKIDWEDIDRRSKERKRSIPHTSTAVLNSAPTEVEPS